MSQREYSPYAEMRVLCERGMVSHTTPFALRLEEALAQAYQRGAMAEREVGQFEHAAALEAARADAIRERDEARAEVSRLRQRHGYERAT